MSVIESLGRWDILQFLCFPIFRQLSHQIAATLPGSARIALLPKTRAARLSRSLRLPEHPESPLGQIAISRRELVAFRRGRRPHSLSARTILKWSTVPPTRTLGLRTIRTDSWIVDGTAGRPSRVLSRCSEGNWSRITTLSLRCMKDLRGAK